jgi:outer membrane protein TolC
MKWLFSLLLLLVLVVKAGAVTPEELKELIDRNSIEIAIQKATVEKLKFHRQATLHSYLPELSVSAGVQEFYPYHTYRTWNQRYSFEITASANPLNLQRNVQLSIDRYSVELGGSELKVLRLNLYYSGLAKLLRLKALEEKLKMKKEILANAEDILRVAKDRFQKGLVLITDVLKAKAEVESARSALEKVKVEYSQVFNELNELVNYALKEGEHPEVELAEAVTIPSEEELIETAMRKRPEVEKVVKELKVAKLKVEHQRRALSPTLNVSASLTRSDTEFPLEEKSYDVSAVLSFPFFDSKLTTFKALALEKEAQAKKLTVKKVENQVKREVKNALCALKGSEKVLASSRAFLELSRATYERVFNEYRLGVSDIVALLQAHENLKKAEESYIDALLDFNLSYLGLMKATGELLGGER